MIKYCTKCLFPETKPHLSFDDEGVCNACINYDNRPMIDWDARRNDLNLILDRYRSKDQSHWDCIIPVSGGKDSTFQAMIALENGMTPLCVTSTTCHMSEIGRYNIENLKRLGVDYIEVSPNPNIRAKLNRVGLEQVGDISWAEHVGMFTIPFRVAVQFNVPLIIYGENPQNEYGGPEDAVNRNFQDRRWLEEYGGMLGLRISDVIGMEGIEKKDMLIYSFPEVVDLKRVGVVGIYLGHYYPWDGLDNYLTAQANGFRSWGKPVEGSAVDYENVDNHQNGIHEYFKYLKYGYGRATDQTSILIRRGRMTRERALSIVKERDGKFPWTYLDKPIEEILGKIDMTLDEFIKICDRFTNKKIFVCDARGKLKKDKDGNLIKLNYDNP
jgi:N-acetyl sugar amidotransferase